MTIPIEITLSYFLPYVSTVLDSLLQRLLSIIYKEKSEQYWTKLFSWLYFHFCIFTHIQFPKITVYVSPGVQVPCIIYIYIYTHITTGIEATVRILKMLCIHIYIYMYILSGRKEFIETEQTIYIYIYNMDSLFVSIYKFLPTR